MNWSEKLKDLIPKDREEAVAQFETQMELCQRGQMELKVFAETRLRLGIYGQRYDNGSRHNGIEAKEIPFPSKALKGPDTQWDAPGMVRIKIPYGKVTPEQLEVLADLAEEVSDGIAHITTRQDFQLHYVHIEDMPELMRRLAAVGITTQEACGNSVRNVTACPYAGVCSTEAFDVTPYADAMTQFFLGHPDAQDFGRKFKIAFSGCEQKACALVAMHDLGGIAKIQEVDGQQVRGFQLWVGGGLGAVPHQAQILEDFVPEEELLPVSQAVARVFSRLGEKKNRARARIKFLVSKLGLEEFRKLVREERQVMPQDPRWKQYLNDLEKTDDVILPAHRSPSGRRWERSSSPNYLTWLKNNVKPQKQKDYHTIEIALPLGDLNSPQLRQLADITKEFVNGNIRTTVEQNFILRWAHQKDLPEIYQRLKEANLADPLANTLHDVTSCPGTDTCKLGIAASRGLAGHLRGHLANLENYSEEAKNLKVKVSGCFNSCGQHHIADIGFYGVSRNRNGYQVPHFQLILGGQWSQNAGSFGLAIGAIPSKHVPTALDRIIKGYTQDKESNEKFQDYVNRTGKKALKESLQDLMEVPSHDEHPEFYSDWGDPRKFTIKDIGVGECAGEVVNRLDFALASAEREVFEAQLELDNQNLKKADALAYHAMLQAARGLLFTRLPDISENPDEIVNEFEKHFVETEIFLDRYAGAKFARYLFKRHRTPPENLNSEKARQIIEESQLFIEATHRCQAQLSNLAQTS